VTTRNKSNLLVVIFTFWMLLTPFYLSWDNIKRNYHPAETKYNYYQIFNISDGFCRVNYQSFFDVVIIKTSGIICIKD
jgi:hypothetical protein